MEKEPNPPLWPNSVLVVHPGDDPCATQLLLEAYSQDAWSDQHQTFTSDFHFSDRRHAILFAPGTYHYTFQVGYYTQVLGLGKSVDDVRFEKVRQESQVCGPYVPALNRQLHPPHGTSLDTFWRCGENYAVQGTVQWAVSQAAPLRRIRVLGDLQLHDGAAYASGGHLANAVVEGQVLAGGQQQFLFRNVHFHRESDGGAWSLVYCGCTGRVPTPAGGTAIERSVSVVPRPRVRREKPYIALADDGVRYQLRIPNVLTYEQMVVGPLVDGSHEQVVDFEMVRVVRSTESSHRIQPALDEGKHVILSPGIYHLEESIRLSRPNQVLLGLGLATLVAPPNGTPCIRVAPNVAGVIVAGVMLEASARDTVNRGHGSITASLLEWGEEGIDDPGMSDQPGALFDVFCRVGGAASGNRSALFLDAMLRIHSGHVMGDNLWLWRADHARLDKSEIANYPHISPIFYQSEPQDFRVETGCVVRGSDVTIFGLAVEHANGHQCVWSGERGAVYFYQSELPYDASHEFAQQGCLGYLVEDTVREHELVAPGIYSNFRNHDVFVHTAIRHPRSPGVRVKQPFAVNLDNKGGILSIVNGEGDTAIEYGRPTRLCKSAASEI